MSNLKMADTMKEAGYTDVAEWLVMVDSLINDLALTLKWLNERGYQLMAEETQTSLFNAVTLGNKIYDSCLAVLAKEGK